jgi:hypothetical protein
VKFRSEFNVPIAVTPVFRQEPRRNHDGTARSKPFAEAATPNQ